MNIFNFFNTARLSGKKLREAMQQATNQCERVKLILYSENRPMTPFEIHEKYCVLYFSCPITSIRRSLSDLTANGEAVKCDQVEEQYGVLNYRWKLA